MFEIEAISVSSAPNAESLHLAEWLCAATVDGSHSVLFDGSSSHHINGDESNWHANAEIRRSGISDSAVLELLDRVGFELEQQCALHVGAEIQARLVRGDTSTTEAQA